MAAPIPQQRPDRLGAFAHATEHLVVWTRAVNFAGAACSFIGAVTQVAGLPVAHSFEAVSEGINFSRGLTGPGRVIYDLNMVRAAVVNPHGHSTLERSLGAIRFSTGLVGHTLLVGSWLEQADVIHLGSASTGLAYATSISGMAYALFGVFHCTAQLYRIDQQLQAAPAAQRNELEKLRRVAIAGIIRYAIMFILMTTTQIMAWQRRPLHPITTASFRLLGAALGLYQIWTRGR